MTPSDPSGEVLVLREHTESIIDLDRETALALAMHPYASLAVAPHPNGWSIKPSSTVGVFSANGRDVLIRPKINISNVMNLLDVTTKSLTWRPDTFDYDVDDNILVALIRLFRRGLDEALSQGIRHDYLERNERLISLRGRIDIGDLSRRPGLASPISCRYDEHTADIELNRLLLSAMLISLRQRHVPDRDRLGLRRHLARFEGVSPKAADPAWTDTWEPSRLEQHYEAAIRAGALLVRGTSPADRVGSRTLGQFTVKMNDLVEDFITQRILRQLPAGIEGRSQLELSLDVADQRQVYPDLTIYRNGSPVLVLDVKYKAVESITDVRTPDIFQLHTYSQLLNLDRGVIVSCVASDDYMAAPEVVTIRETGVTIELWPIDLRGSPQQLDQQIAMIIDRILGQISESPFRRAG